MPRSATKTLLVLSTAWIALQAAPCSAASIALVRDNATISHAILEGIINDGDSDTLAFLAASEASQGRRVVALSLNSPGGSAWEGFKVAQVMRHYGMAAAVEGGRSCNSSCFTLLALGREKFVAPSSNVYVHRVAEKGADTPETRAWTMDMAVLYKSIGVPDSVLGGMVTTPHQDGYRVGLDELRRMGATVTMDGRPPSDWNPGKPDAPKASTVAAKKLDADIAVLVAKGEAVAAAGPVATTLPPSVATGFGAAGLVLLGSLATGLAFAAVATTRRIGRAKAARGHAAPAVG